MTTGDGLRIGISGVGSIGTRHARVFGAEPGVTTVLYDRGVTRDELSARFPQAEAVNSFDELLDASLDGIVVATPDQAHPAQASAASRRGLPVLLEKPVAASRAAATPITAALRDGGAPILVGYVLRHLKCLARARQMLAAGEIGEPVSFHATLGAYETLVAARSRFASPVRDSLFVDYSHEWDYLRWLLGPIEGGFALAHTSGNLPLRQEPNVVDCVLRLQTGVTGSVHLDYVQQRGARACEVIGDAGVLRIDVIRGVVSLQRVAEPPQVEELAWSRDELFQTQARHFLDVVAGNATPVVGLEEGLASVDVAEALIASAASGRWEVV